MIGTIWRLMTSTWSIESRRSCMRICWFSTCRLQQRVIDLEAVNLLQSSLVPVFEAAGFLDDAVDPLLRFLGETRAAGIDVQYFIKRLGQPTERH